MRGYVYIGCAWVLTLVHDMNVRRKGGLKHMRIYIYTGVYILIKMKENLFADVRMMGDNTVVNCVVFWRSKLRSILAGKKTSLAAVASKWLCIFLESGGGIPNLRVWVRRGFRGDSSERSMEFRGANKSISSALKRPRNIICWSLLYSPQRPLGPNPSPILSSQWASSIYNGLMYIYLLYVFSGPLTRLPRSIY